MGRKVGAAMPFSGSEWISSGYPSNTVSPGLKPTSVPSGILILPAVWPQVTWAENWGVDCCAPFSQEEELGPHLTQDGGRPPCWISKNRDVSVTVWPIATKFGMIFLRNLVHLEVMSFWGQQHYQTAAGSWFATSKAAILKILMTS